MTRNMPQPPHEETEPDPEVEVDPAASPSLFDDEDEEYDTEDDALDDVVEEEEIDLDDLAAMEGPDA